MKSPWNWQLPDWPNFRWDPLRLAKAEEQFVHGAGVLVGAAKHLGADEQQALSIDVLSDEAMTTSAIEGEVLDRNSVQASILVELGLPGGRFGLPPAERGIGMMMVDLFRGFGEPLDSVTLGRWQALTVNGRADLRDIGRYRTHAEPMRIVSWTSRQPRVHFEAPPSSLIESEMSRYIGWFNDTAPDGRSPLPALTRAGVAHLYFESIHPFEDGNGRVGRAIAEKALAQTLERSALTALASAILARRRSYYEALAAASTTNEITPWLAWFAATALEAQQRTLARVEFVIDKAALLDRLRHNLNPRQEKVLVRVLGEGPGGFKGGLSAGNYATIANTSASTATRDLAELVAMGGLRREGELRHARYYPTIPDRPSHRIEIDPTGQVIRPSN